MMDMGTFKDDLVRLDSAKIVRKYIFNGSCSVIDDESYYYLREDVSSQFNINFTDVFVVGSGKLGFSIKPNKRYYLFGEHSDIDVAIVSTKFFEQVWQDAFLYKKNGAFWHKKEEFFKYLAIGWIRPDKLPPSNKYNFSREWWDFFESLTRSRKYGSYKISAGLYHSWFFLQEYQMICVSQ